MSLLSNSEKFDLNKLEIIKQILFFGINFYII